MGQNQICNQMHLTLNVITCSYSLKFIHRIEQRSKNDDGASAAWHRRDRRANWRLKRPILTFPCSPVTPLLPEHKPLLQPLRSWRVTAGSCQVTGPHSSPFNGSPWTPNQALTLAAFALVNHRCAETFPSWLKQKKGKKRGLKKNTPASAQFHRSVRSHTGRFYVYEGTRS